MCDPIAAFCDEYYFRSSAETDSKAPILGYITTHTYQTAHRMDFVTFAVYF